MKEGVHFNPRRPKVFGTRTRYQGGGRGLSEPPPHTHTHTPISRTAHRMKFKFGTLIVQFI